MMSFDSFLKTFEKIEPLSNFDIIEKCKELNILNFQGVFMRDELNRNRSASDNECLILNLDDSTNSGTHWTSLSIQDGICYYFDSFGLDPPLEVKEYLRKYEIRQFNTFEIQQANQIICGHFCIYMLYRLNSGDTFDQVLYDLVRYNDEKKLLAIIK